MPLARAAQPPTHATMGAGPFSVSPPGFITFNALRRRSARAHAPPTPPLPLPSRLQLGANVGLATTAQVEPAAVAAALRSEGDAPDGFDVVIDCAGFEQTMQASAWKDIPSCTESPAVRKPRARWADQERHCGLCRQSRAAANVCAPSMARPSAEHACMLRGHAASCSPAAWRAGRCSAWAARRCSKRCGCAAGRASDGCLRLMGAFHAEHAREDASSPSAAGRAVQAAACPAHAASAGCSGRLRRRRQGGAGERCAVPDKPCAARLHWRVTRMHPAWSTEASTAAATEGPVSLL